MKLFKWLLPGLRIKRWIFVILLGVFFAVLGTVEVLAYLFRVEEVTRGRIDLAIALGCFLISAAALVTGIYRLMKSLGELLDRRGSRKDIVDLAYEKRYLERGPRVVALGGGTGLSVVLTGIKEYTRELTAVVSMADDGGSSGRLRQELDIVPPGDIRKCLIALADEEPLMSELLGYRFPDSELAGHCFGNLFLLVLARLRGDFGEAVREANRILSVRGRVIPSTLDRIFLVANHADGTKTTGQRLISESSRKIVSLELKPNPGPAAPDVIRAIEEADLIVLGPGSLYTSVLPNLLIDGVARAIDRSAARKVYVCNVMSHEGETKDYGVRDYLDAICSHTKPYRVFDTVLVNNGNYSPEADRILKERNAKPVMLRDPAELRDYAVEVVLEDVINPSYPLRHDSRKLANALMGMLKDRKK
ncbi:MAG: uridine diphosphate-N-acetylglucosamine-binding protein YvcK [Planctomycetota bacterium]|nr:uridine diphosphate-N-acetylglucosamine-binding protein YvcK [Planctomycetota bacterium]